MNGLFHRTLFAAGAAGLGATGVASAGPLSANPVYLTTEHIDLNIGYSGGAWSLGPRAELNPPAEYAGENAVLYVHPLAKQTAPGGLAFTGAAAGEDLYVLPQSQLPKLLYLGTSAYGADSGTFDRWSPATESKGRITGFARYLRTGLAQVKGPGRFSVWSNESFGTIVPYMSSYNDGVANPNGAGLDHTDGISADDALWLPTGGHVHFNFGFTRPGLYEVRLNTAGHLEDGVTGTTGPRVSSAVPFSIYFNVHPNYAKAGLVGSSAQSDRGDVAIGAYNTLHSTAIATSDSGSIDVTGAGAAEEVYVLLDLADPSLAGAVAVALNGFEPSPETGLDAEDAVPPVALLDPSLLAQYGAYAGGSYDVALRYGLPPGTTFDFEFDFASILDGVEVTNVGVVAVPEPGSVASGAVVGAAGLLLRRRKRCNAVVALAVVLCAACVMTPAHQATAAIYSKGHADVGVAIESGQLSLFYNFDGSSVIDGVELGGPPGARYPYEPSGVITRLVHEPVPRPANFSGPPDYNWDFIGNGEGEAVWYIPEVQSDAPDRPWLGFGTERLSAGDIVGDVSYAITDFDGPGEFAMFFSDPLGVPQVQFSTAHGDLTYSLQAGTHAHFMWTFTAPGIYQIELTAAVTPSGGGGPISDTETFTFEVANVPEPASLSVLGMAGGLALLRLRRRRVSS